MTILFVAPKPYGGGYFERAGSVFERGFCSSLGKMEPWFGCPSFSPRVLVWTGWPSLSHGVLVPASWAYFSPCHTHTHTHTHGTEVPPLYDRKHRHSLQYPQGPWAIRRGVGQRSNKNLCLVSCPDGNPFHCRGTCVW